MGEIQKSINTLTKEAKEIRKNLFKIFKKIKIKAFTQFDDHIPSKSKTKKHLLQTLIRQIELKNNDIIEYIGLGLAKSKTLDQNEVECFWCNYSDEVFPKLHNEKFFSQFYLGHFLFFFLF